MPVALNTVTVIATEPLSSAYPQKSKMILGYIGDRLTGEAVGNGQPP